MDWIDFLRAIVRWIHAIAAVVWVGGSIFYLFVLRPAIVDGQVDLARIEPPVNRRFRDLVDLAIISLIVTGVVITFDRLSSAPITRTYYIILGLKLLTAVSMLFLARELGATFRPKRRATPAAPQEPSLADRQPRRTWLRWFQSPSRLILLLGLLAFFLSFLLAHVYERGIANLS